MKFSTDVWFCSFLMSKGYKIEKYDVIQRGRVKCYFTLSDEQWQKLKLEFNNSDIIKFKMYIEQIKDLSF
jgi:hypothetical protein